MREHTKDSDCTVDPETGCCRECGVGHDGVKCPDCGGDAFHKDGCPQVAENLAIHDELMAAFQAVR